MKKHFSHVYKGGFVKIPRIGLVPMSHFKSVLSRGVSSALNHVMPMGVNVGSSIVHHKKNSVGKSKRVHPIKFRY